MIRLYWWWYNCTERSNLSWIIAATMKSTTAVISKFPSWNVGKTLWKPINTPPPTFPTSPKCSEVSASVLTSLRLFSTHSEQNSQRYWKRTWLFERFAQWKPIFSAKKNNFKNVDICFWRGASGESNHVKILLLGAQEKVMLGLPDRSGFFSRACFGSFEKPSSYSGTFKLSFSDSVFNSESEKLSFEMRNSKGNRLAPFVWKLDFFTF